MGPSNGWHRDHIYYNMTTSTTRGAFDLDFKERITYIQFTSESGYQKISDQSADPRADLVRTTSDNPPPSSSAWTDGSFEFLANALVSAKIIGQPAVKPRFFAKGDELIRYRIYEDRLERV